MSSESNSSNDDYIKKLRKLFTMEPELPNDLKPVDEEKLLQDKLNEWIERVNWLNEELEIASAKVKFYEKAIKSYNKTFKK